MNNRGLVQALLLGAYAGIAAFAWWLAVGWNGDAGFGFGLAVGGGVFFGLIWFHEAVSARVQRWSAAAALEALEKSQAALERKITRVQTNIEDIRATVGIGQGSGGQQDVIGEMRVIRGLLKKLTDKRTPGSGDAMTEDFAPKIMADDLSPAEILDIIRVGLEQNRVDLYLQPVVSLPQRKIRFYEVFSRIRREDGTVMLPQQYLQVAAEQGLIATIDNFLLFRCIQLVRRVRRDKLEVGFFCNLSRHALADKDFFPQLTEFLERNSGLTEALFFELSQQDAEDPVIAPRLAELRALGFRFSMDNVSALDLNFESLAARQFRFVKLEADKLLSDQTQSEMSIHVADLKEAMKRAGIDLIAEKIEHETEVVGLLEFNVDLGQGFLFGEPMPARNSA